MSDAPTTPATDEDIALWKSGIAWTPALTERLIARIEAEKAAKEEAHDKGWNEAVEASAKAAHAESERHTISSLDAGTHGGWLGGKIAKAIRTLAKHKETT